MPRAMRLRPRNRLARNATPVLRLESLAVLRAEGQRLIENVAGQQRSFDSVVRLPCVEHLLRSASANWRSADGEAPSVRQSPWRSVSLTP